MKLLALSVCLLLLAVPNLMEAQDPVGAIEGLVSDPSNATISAHVVATNLDTGLQREADATNNGLFRIPLLPVGRYSVSVEAPKFAKSVQEPVTVNIGQSVRLAFTLEVASLKSSVTVLGDAPLVDVATTRV